MPVLVDNSFRVPPSLVEECVVVGHSSVWLLLAVHSSCEAEM